MSLLQLECLDELLQDVHVLVEQVEKDVLCEVVLDQWVHLLSKEVLDDLEKHREGLLRERVALELCFLYRSEESDEELKATLGDEGFAELSSLGLEEIFILVCRSTGHSEWALSDQIVEKPDHMVSFRRHL